jgi:glycosyltransferase involved in cell wall biosynthesis
MKILHVLFRMRMGGTECMLIDIMRRQATLSHDVSLIIINNDSDPALLAQIPEQVRTISINRREGSKNPLKVWKYNRAVRGLRPDVIHIHNKQAVSMLIGSQAAMVQTLHTTGITLTPRQAATRLTAISDEVAREIRERQGLDAVVIPNGIETSRIVRRTTPPQAPLWGDMVSVGRLETATKGQDLLIQAMALLPADAHLTLIGDGSDRATLQAMAEALKVADRVTFAGTTPRDELYATLHRHRLFVLPSRVEGFGLVLAEAMCAGLPVVTADLNGPMQVIGRGKYGTTFAAGDAAALANAIIHAKPHAEAADFAVKEFDINSTVDRLIDVYTEEIKKLAATQ